MYKYIFIVLQSCITAHPFHMPINAFRLSVSLSLVPHAIAAGVPIATRQLRLSRHTPSTIAVYIHCTTVLYHSTPVSYADKRLPSVRLSLSLVIHAIVAVVPIATRQLLLRHTPSTIAVTAIEVARPTGLTLTAGRLSCVA